MYCHSNKTKNLNYSLINVPSPNVLPHIKVLIIILLVAESYGQEGVGDNLTSAFMGKRHSVT